MNADATPMLVIVDVAPQVGAPFQHEDVQSAVHELTGEHPAREASPNNQIVRVQVAPLRASRTLRENIPDIGGETWSL